jgi:APA family basic amino acid/polyamine antiporter
LKIYPDKTKNEKRVLGFWTSTSLVVGNMIGSGIFLLPSALAVYGGISIFGWMFTTIGAILLALVFVNLSSEFPNIGGPYYYARKGFGDFSGFIVAYGYWISILCGNAAISVALVSYLAMFIPALSKQPILGALGALVSLWILTFINSADIRISGRVQFITTVLKILPLIAIAFFGIFYFEPTHFIPLNISGETSFTAITATAALTLWAFLGLESATIPANNIKKPKRTIPRATITGTLIAALVYIVATVSVMGIISPTDLSNSNAPFADAAAQLWGPVAGYIIAAAGVVACFGALNGWILLQGQIPLAAAIDNLFPKKFANLSKAGTPVFGLILSSILISLIMILNFTNGLVEKFTFIILLATLATLVPYLFSTLAQLKFIYLARNNKTLIKLSIITILAFLYSVWAVIGLGIFTIIWGVIFIATGIPIFVWMRTRRVKDH